MRFDRRDAVRPRLAQAEAVRLLKGPFYDPARSFLTGRTYRPVLDPSFSIGTPAPAIRRDGTWQSPCPFAASEHCDFASASGIAMQAHVQTAHVSRNDRPALVGGTAYRPRTWWAGGRITDVAGRRDLVRALGARRVGGRRPRARVPGGP